ncbi:MAG: metallophosphoesterase family protein [Alphaproteobacteria bacterium]|nr:metallophosphoesterase family protein [Alphaproteobacteria bacterium]
MLIGLLADIHANLEALEACLAHGMARGVRRWIALGDQVGYGADPLAVLARLQAIGALCLMGNHDEAALTGPRGFSEAAAEAVRWTAKQLDEPARTFLRALPMVQREGEILFVHADAAEPAAWHYVTDARRAARSLDGTDARFVFSGHTHQPLLAGISATGRMTLHRPTPNVSVPLSPLRRAQAVLGAAGQPRDGNPAACYGLLDSVRMECTWMRVPYDVAGAAAKITAAGLPAMLASRLEKGR